jgi:hypothetical protein
VSPRGTAIVAVILAALVGTHGPAVAQAAPFTWKSRIASAVDYAHHRSGTVTFALADEAGRLHGYHARAIAPSASVLKAMLLVAYLRRSDVRNRPLARWERNLLGPMIRRSDNDAATRMVGLTGSARLNRLARAAGMEHFRLHWPIWGESEITPRGQALYFRRIDSLVPPRHRAYALRLLATVVPSERWGVGRVPHGRWHLYFKGGWGSGTGWVDHQVALYSVDGERFSFALFTRFDPDHAYGEETLRGLAARLLRGTASPGGTFSRVARAALGRGYAVTARGDCRKVAIRPLEGGADFFQTGASSCGGFQLASAGHSALWSWPRSGGSELATASAGDAGPTDLGNFDASDPLGELVGGRGLLAYGHGAEVTAVGGDDCPAPVGAVIAAWRDRIVAASRSSIEVRNASTCALQRFFHAKGSVTALALDDRTLVSLSRGSGGRAWLERDDLATGARLGRSRVSSATLPELSIQGEWAVYRTPHSLHVLRTRSGRSWTVWRPARSPVASGLSGRKLAWIEQNGDRSRLWSLRLP